jgi:hypothetical protein
MGHWAQEAEGHLALSRGERGNFYSPHYPLSLLPTSSTLSTLDVFLGERCFSQQLLELMLVCVAAWFAR